MINSFIYNKILEYFPFEPTGEQSKALEALSNFIVSPRKDMILLFKGYAGTGKTTMLGATVKAVNLLKQKTVLLAPTGRAAKVFSEYAEHNACTIHKKIYRKKSFSDDFRGFVLLENLHKDTLFIVDEASMISNEPAEINVFGSGHLLDDLIKYVYSGENCKAILLGDTAQLPPVSLNESPALNARYLERYNLQVTEIELTQVVRQSQDSGILLNATNIRDALRNGKIGMYPNICTENYPDVKKIRGDELIEEISSSYGKTGIDDTMVICRSNKNANIYNNGIRNRILYREEEISSGDRLMVVKNNYYWPDTGNDSDFIANGETVRVLRVRRMEEMYGFRFCNVWVAFEDYGTETELKIMLDALSSESPALTREQNSSLFAAVNENYAHIQNKRERMKKIKNDPYFNALQVKYAYAVTCHKAQGGQWSNVFLDIGYVTEEMMGEDFYRWLYTAFTRATRKLFLVNWRLGKI
ncbi:MAG: AAA family ATPase [Prevotellaceae bacterium]|jgi:exodeoxyribonuclease-5|nr:AAA family ATPase [Prevotellaceae bacterium]